MEENKKKENARAFMSHELSEATRQFQANAPEGTERGYIIISYETRQREDGKTKETYVGCQLGGSTEYLIAAVRGVLDAGSSEENPTPEILKIAMLAHFSDVNVSSENKTFTAAQLETEA